MGHCELFSSELFPPPVVCGTLTAILVTVWWWVSELDAKGVSDSHPLLQKIHAERVEMAKKIKELGTGPISLASILVGLGMACFWQTSKVSAELPFLGKHYVSLFGFVGVVAGALLVDSVMDHNLELRFTERWFFLNGGYVLFAALMTCIAWLLVYGAMQDHCFREDGLIVASFAIVPASMFFKVMCKDKDYGFWLLALILSSVWVWTSIFMPKDSPPSGRFGIFLSVMALAGIKSCFSLRKLQVKANALDHRGVTCASTLSPRPACG